IRPSAFPGIKHQIPSRIDSPWRTSNIPHSRNGVFACRSQRRVAQKPDAEENRAIARGDSQPDCARLGVAATERDRNSEGEHGSACPRQRRFAENQINERGSDRSRPRISSTEIKKSVADALSGNSRAAGAGSIRLDILAGEILEVT